MKFVNPMGREPGSGIQPRACTCIVVQLSRQKSKLFIMN